MQHFDHVRSLESVRSVHLFSFDFENITFYKRKPFVKLFCQVNFLSLHTF